MNKKLFLLLVLSSGYGFCSSHDKRGHDAESDGEFRERGCSLSPCLNWAEEEETSLQGETPPKQKLDLSTEGPNWSLRSNDDTKIEELKKNLFIFGVDERLPVDERVKNLKNILCNYVVTIDEILKAYFLLATIQHPENEIYAQVYLRDALRFKEDKGQVYLDCCKFALARIMPFRKKELLSAAYDFICIQKKGSFLQKLDLLNMLLLDLWHENEISPSSDLSKQQEPYIIEFVQALAAISRVQCDAVAVFTHYDFFVRHLIDKTRMALYLQFLFDFASFIDNAQKIEQTNVYIQGSGFAGFVTTSRERYIQINKQNNGVTKLGMLIPFRNLLSIDRF